MAKMKTAVVVGPREIRLDESDVPEIGAHEVLVRVKAVGIAEADLHYYKHGPDIETAVEDYLRMGRGTAGEIVGVGSDVEDRRAGQRVAVTPGHPCMTCEACRSGEFGACPATFLLSHPPLGGSYADHILVPAWHTCVLPDTVGFDECAMLVPFAVGFHAVRRAGMSVARSVGIIGADEVGLMCLLAARISGAGRIVVADAYPGKLEAANRLGASEVIDTSRTNPTAVVDELTGGDGLDIVLECSGRPGALADAIGMAGCRSVVVSAGVMPPIPTEIPTMDIIVKEIDVRGVFRHVESPEPAATVITRRMVDLGAVITERFPFDRIWDALRYADDREEEATKVVVEF